MAAKYYECKDPTVPGQFEAYPHANGAVGVYMQGGGFVRALSERDFGAQFREVQPNFACRRGTVTADFLADGTAVPCLGTSQRSNGFSLPLFERAAVQTLLSLLVDVNGRAIARWAIDGSTVQIYNEEYDSSRAESKENAQYHDFSPQQVEVGGQSVTAWQIGDGWTWEPIDFDAAKRQATILRMQDEILRDVLTGSVPRTVGDFSDVQAHVDANMYGGLGETGAFPEGWSVDGQMTTEHVDFINACQKAVCQWIEQGGISAIDALAQTDGGPGASYYRVTDEKDAADYVLLVTDQSCRQRPANPESDEICFTIRHGDNAELVGVHRHTGRAGLIAWYLEHVGHNPDHDDEGGPRPILELVTSVALHLMYRAIPEF